MRDGCKVLAQHGTCGLDGRFRARDRVARDNGVLDDRSKAIAIGIWKANVPKGAVKEIKELYSR